MERHTKEWGILLSSLRKSMGLDEDMTFEHQVLDWQKVYALARAHKVVAHVHKQIKDLPQAVPAQVMQMFQEASLEQALLNLALTSELLKVIKLFEEASIPVLTFKGPVLAMQLYQDLGMRQYADVDILIPKIQLAKAKRCLLEAGYQPDHQLDASQEAAFTYFLHELGFRKTRGHKVELHWRLFERYFSSLVSDSIFKRAQAFHLLNHKVQTFSSEDSLLYLCIHGAKHLWGQLSLIADVARLMLVQPLDWNRLFEQARLQTSERMLLLGLVLAKRVLAVTLPADVLARAKRDPSIAALASQLEQQLQMHAISTLKTYRFHIHARERLADKLRYAALSLAAPTPHDWAFLRLPENLFPLYYLVRPIRLLTTYAQDMLEQARDVPQKPSR